MNIAKLTRRSAALAAMLLSLSAARNAGAADYTATGVIISGQAPSLIFTNDTGQVQFRGNMHTVLVTSSDARMTGRRRITVDGHYNADGTASIWGECYQEVGTWADLNFTPSGAVWDIRYTGTIGLDNSLLLHLTGSGHGNSIDGMRLDETLTRGAVPTPDDATTPYQYVGSLNPPPAFTQTVLDDFNAPPLGSWDSQGSGGGSLTESGGVLKVHGNWPGTVTRQHADTYFWGRRPVAWTIADGRTLEWRVRLASLTEGATNAAAVVVGRTSDSHIYLFFKGTTFVQLGKWHGGMSLFFHDNVALPNADLILSLSMTRVQSNLILTTRVLDPSRQDAVLYQRTTVETPQADACLTSTELRAQSGMSLGLVPDEAELPILAGDRVLLEAWQYTDGNQPPVDVTYDDLEMRTYETPQLGIEPSVTLLVPENFRIERAANIAGPWAPVVEAPVPGLLRVSVPSHPPAGYFRALPRP